MKTKIIRGCTIATMGYGRQTRLLGIQLPKGLVTIDLTRKDFRGNPITLVSIQGDDGTAIEEPMFWKCGVTGKNHARVTITHEPNTPDSTLRYLLEYLSSDYVWVPEKESDSIEQLRDIPIHIGTPYQIFDRTTGKRRKVIITGTRRNTLGRWLKK